MPRINELVPLKLQLFDGDTTKYVRAHVFDESQNELPNSPFNLIHFGRGLYASNALLMPDTTYITIQYRVYDDSNYSIISSTHSDTLDIYYREEPDPEIMVSLIEIKSLIGALTGGVIAAGNMLQGYVESSNIHSYIDDKSLIGLVTDGELKGDILSSSLKEKVFDSLGMKGDIGC